MRSLHFFRLETIRLYYKSPKFVLIDLVFGFFALFSNPYRVCRKFLQKKGAVNIYAYGETPFSTYQRLVDMCEVNSCDIWIELGSGRGKGCFWLAHFVGCQVVGIEWIALFVRLANFIKTLFRMKNLNFVRADITQADLTKATVIYLYGLWPDVQIPSGVKVITVSEPLQGYTVLKKFWVRYPWGRTTAYLQVPIEKKQSGVYD